MKQYQWGLCNGALDAEIEAQVRLDNPNMADNAVLQEVNRIKKDMGYFTERNTKGKSAQAPRSARADEARGVV